MPFITELGGWIFIINSLPLNCDIVNGLEDRAIECLGKWYWALGCKSVMGKYWTGYNIYCSWIWTCIIWIKSVVEGLRCLNNGICEYWCQYSVDCISSVFAIFPGVSGVWNVMWLYASGTRKFSSCLRMVATLICVDIYGSYKQFMESTSFIVLWLRWMTENGHPISSWAQCLLIFIVTS